MSAPVPEIKIVHAGPNDLDKLVKISRATFSETYAGFNTPENMQHYLEHNFGPGQLSEELNHPASAFYFAEIGGEIAGYFKINAGAAQTVKDQYNSLELERIYVLKEAQGKGAGQLMLQKAIDITADQRLSYLWLGVWEHNPRAIRFYQRNGFSVYGTHIFKLGNDDQTDHLMKFPIFRS